MLFSVLTTALAFAGGAATLPNALGLEPRQAAALDAAMSKCTPAKYMRDKR
jgi:hypothetical protein